MVIAVLATSFVFADESQSVLSKVSGLSDEQIAALNQNQRGFGRVLTASVVAKLTGMSVEDVLEANQAGATFFEIAQGKGIELEQYKKAVLDEKLTYVDEQVKAGILTEDQGKIIESRMTENINNCNGLGRGMGMRNGQDRGLSRFNSSNQTNFFNN